MSGARGRARSARHDAAWRDPAQVASHWREAGRVEPGQLRHRVRGAFWEVLDALQLTLLVTREYEHLVVALSVGQRGPEVSFFPLPHCSGIAFDRARGRVHIASTRNPNQVFTFAPAVGVLDRGDADVSGEVRGRLLPVGTSFFPGSLYLHDLAFIGDELVGNVVGHNAVARLGPDGAFERLWWPRCVERDGAPDFTRNYLQLNSIAAGPTLERSYFTASAERMGARRPGHKNFPVDGRGVLFSGATRAPIARGLTRPHSARLAQDGSIWLCNSGYGEVGPIDGARLAPVAALAGWTRGLALVGHVAFVGISRVLPRFRQYAPGLELERTRCAVVAFETGSGRELGRLDWPAGNQLFAIEPVPRAQCAGFPFRLGDRGRSPERLKAMFYAYATQVHP